MIDYKRIVDKLELVVPQYNNGRYWNIELLERHIDGEDIKLIYLYNTGNSNKYRLYHSELDDRVKTDKELLECCIENLHEVYKEIKSVMSSVLDSWYVMLGEMEE